MLRPYGVFGVITPFNYYPGGAVAAIFPAPTELEEETLGKGPGDELEVFAARVTIMGNMELFELADAPVVQMDYLSWS